ncbi:asparagine synthase (glutamine-hydrolyzing) [Chitinophaga silvatica]|uniref:asparagine synthase (glutamine-hydrolyzing) n=1 Tax=Chitinophaga silvatica TaxID=2282649 RepID=A0A3E1YCJ5_9BACT|nr:asparagine synthase (glutamine-hydrolyzing) [Chitinophaga silvatica]RFS23950.1 asparagine synthase (glutamine-hydrolyzing) [Chitinophaga silvatica]
MCGIAGFIDFKCQTNLTTLRNMTDAMTHRGPDDSGYELFEKEQYVLGFGHRRLSIIDLSPLGHQPFHDDDNKWTILFNGEVYNYNELRNELIAQGHSFRSHSDTEVILKAFRHWGKKAIDRFIGMFVFFIYDNENHKVYAYRDRSGVKPLYYYYKDDLFLFGSELKAFHQHNRFNKTINKEAFALFLQYGYIPAPHCIFNDTFKLKPGHYLEIDLLSKKIVNDVYWDVLDAYNKPKLKISETEALEETEKLLKSAFEYRMVADVPVGIFLSGGYDSSIVAAMLQKERSQKLKTFTIGFNEKDFNEAPHAKNVADYLGTDHTEYICSPKDALEIIPKLPFIFDEPFGDSSAIPTILVSQLARQQVTVSLSADAGDEVFGGYNKYAEAIRLHKMFTKFPDLVNKTIGKMMDLIPAKTIPFHGRFYNFETRYEKMKSLLKAENTVKTMQCISQHLTNKELELFIGQFNQSLPLHFDDYNQLNKYNDDINQMLAIDYKTYMDNDILVKVDRATMSVSLEGREPLLDHRIIEFVAQLPSEFKIKDGNKKYLLKQITHKYLPKQLMDRPKMGFGVPLIHWFKKELKGYFNTYLTKERADRHQLYDPAITQEWIKSYENNNNSVTRLWFLLMFEMWYDEWMK